MKLRTYEKVTKKEWYITAVIFLIFIILLGVSSRLFSGFMYFWVLTVLVGITLLGTRNTKNLAYVCPRCGKVFEISPWEDFFRPNAGGKKYLRCPECRRQAWVDILEIEE